MNTDKGMLSLTPRFSGVMALQPTTRTVLTVFRLLQCAGSPAAGKTVETVFDLQGFRITPLKRGVNESQSNCCYLFGGGLVLELE